MSTYRIPANPSRPDHLPQAPALAQRFAAAVCPMTPPMRDKPPVPALFRQTVFTRRFRTAPLKRRTPAADEQEQRI
jgi:hypothetical protein